MLVDKLSIYLKRIRQNLPEMAFLLFSMRLIVLGANIGDSLALVSIAGILAFKWYLNKEKHEALEKFNTEIEDIKNHVQALKLDKMVKRSVVNEPQAAKEKRYF